MADTSLTSLTDYGTSLLNTAKSNSDVSTIKSAVGSVGKDSTEDELLGACKQFEAYLWEQILKEVDKSVNLFGVDTDSGSYASNMFGVFQDTLIQEMSDKITETGSDNSLAMSLYEQLKRNYGIGTVTPEEIDTEEIAKTAAESGLVNSEEN